MVRKTEVAPDPDAPRFVSPDPHPVAAEADLTVRALPEPEPASVVAAPATAARAEIVELPEIVVTAAPRVDPAIGRREGSNRLSLYAGAAVAVVAIAAAGWWFIGRSAPAPTPAEAPPALDNPAPVVSNLPAAAVEAPTEDAGMTAQGLPGAEASTSASETSAAPARPAPATVTSPTAPVRPTPVPGSTPVPAPPPAVVVTAPPIAEEPAGPPPTAATRLPEDPDAPIATRPQALD
ncbi:hypothetical protein [Brevundimonas sp. FT23042]|uniref:hypothetical protein n=1 Tax=Brevundimonas sp. FT23042 TaxID=3393749 RepID=UPI003B586CA5